MTDANGCVIYTAPVSVTTSDIPAAPSATASTQCGTGIPGIKVSGAAAGTGYNWYLAATGGSPIQSGTVDSLSSYSISATTTFYVSTQLTSSPYCESPRTAVVATVNLPDAISIGLGANNVCPGTAVTLTANQTGTNNTYVYTWNGAGLSSTSGSTITATPTTGGAQVYNVTAVDAALGCTTTATVTLTTVIPPAIATATASPSVLCAGSATTLTATKLTVAGFNAALNDSSGTSTTYSGPFYSAWSNKNQQILFTAAELTAAGITPGALSGLQFSITSGTTSLVNFSIGLCNTTATSLSLIHI